MSSERGLFITFEGGEGTGKSCQIERFAAYLRAQGKEVICTREPGGTEIGKAIRKLLVEGDKDKFDELTELLLFYADRRINLTKVIWPAIEQGKIVLSDRFNDSTIAYQYYGSAKFKDTKIIDTLYEMVAPNFKPDLTFLLDIDVKTGLARSFAKAEGMENKELRFENTEIAFHERLRQGYLSLAKKEEKRFRVIEAAADIESVTKKIIETYQEFRATSYPTTQTYEKKQSSELF